MKTSSNSVRPLRDRDVALEGFGTRLCFISIYLKQKGLSQLFNLFYGCFIQWCTQRGGQGAMAPPPVPGSQGAKLSFGPPHSKYARVFFSNIHNTLLFIVYLITREGNSHVRTFSIYACLFLK